MHYLVTGFFLITLGVPAFCPFLGIFASFCGYALFFQGMLLIKKRRFLTAFLGFFFSQMVLLSWMSSIKYVGPLICVAYVGFSIFIALQFGCISLFIRKDLSFSLIFFLSGMWALLEYSRMFLLSGYTWNPIGMSLTCNTYSSQLASIIGIYGLSFFVIFTNLFFLKWIREKKYFFPLVFLIVFPYVFGFFHQRYSHRKDKGRYLKVLLVQPALMPDQKDPSFCLKNFLPLSLQWRRLLSLIADQKEKPDLIVFPETAIYFDSCCKVCKYEDFENIWKPLMQRDPIVKKKKFSNLDFAKNIGEYFDAEVIIGLDHREMGKNYNSAFYLKKDSYQRYDKKVLIPIVEYFPFSWCYTIAKAYGIGDVFQKGKTDGIVQGIVPIGLSICYEETYGHKMREIRKKGASLFVNISNDSWFPNSKLSWQHFFHGKLRGIENGVPVLRACNTGVTAALDCFGRVVDILDKNVKDENSQGSLFVKLPLDNCFTLYSFWGDNFIIFLSIFFITCFLLKKFFRKNIS